MGKCLLAGRFLEILKFIFPRSKSALPGRNVDCHRYSNFFVYCTFAAFQNALKIFHRIKGGRVPASEVDKVLDSMDILVVPETLQEVIKYANINSELFESMSTYFFLGYQFS